MSALALTPETLLQRKSADFRIAFQSHLDAHEADVRTRFRQRLLEIRELHRIANPSTRITWTKFCPKYLGIKKNRADQILAGTDGNESRRAKKAANVTENAQSDCAKLVTKPKLTLVPDPIPEISETEEDDNDVTSGSVELPAVSEAPSAEAPAASCADDAATCKLAKAPKRKPSPECYRAILALQAITNADDRSIVHFWIGENWP
jgi:hypothetical protein